MRSVRNPMAVTEPTATANASSSPASSPTVPQPSITFTVEENISFTVVYIISSKKRWVNDIVRSIPLAQLWTLKFLDPFHVKHQPRAHELASGIHILARKPLDAATAAEG